MRGVPLSKRTSVRGGPLQVPCCEQRIAERLEPVLASRQIPPPAHQHSYPEGSRTPSKPVSGFPEIPMRRSACRECSPRRGIATNQELPCSYPPSILAFYQSSAATITLGKNHRR